MCLLWPLMINCIVLCLFGSCSGRVLVSTVCYYTHGIGKLYSQKDTSTFLSMRRSFLKLFFSSPDANLFRETETTKKPTWTS